MRVRVRFGWWIEGGHQPIANSLSNILYGGQLACWIVVALDQSRLWWLLQVNVRSPCSSCSCSGPCSSCNRTADRPLQDCPGPRPSTAKLHQLIPINIVLALETSMLHKSPAAHLPLWWPLQRLLQPACSYDGPCRDSCCKTALPPSSLSKSSLPSQPCCHPCTHPVLPLTDYCYPISQTHDLSASPASGQ